jgi:hypothetical protein
MHQKQPPAKTALACSAEWLYPVISSNTSTLSEMDFMD